eukprot:CAMPEP_0204277234 /NCGR_PEP_ID=MMETSP0468-20130131/29184_1 /ASSEMBLY_ACC=CAM_ASM_000383 /TAXON_ID=2969 /ORGANISM="Oxyrrhis marina" /LENGTH=338 /DNA_ID=CAMNT_0051253979 /DNA_START=24 /DNA_END=1040 /DNA_ORIENTATION=+
MTAVQHMNLKATENLATKAHLKASFQIGSTKSDRMNYSRSQKVFAKSDVPEHARALKKEVNRQIRPDTLTTQPSWNQSTLAAKEEEPKDLKRTLLKVRAGLMDEPKQNFKDKRSEEEIGELVRYVTQISGQGPIGKLTTKWFNPVDERCLNKHTIREDWPDWDGSTTTFTKEDEKRRIAWYEKLEDQRVKHNPIGKKVDQTSYINPATQTVVFNDLVREKKLIHQEIKEQFKAELKQEFPNASEERLQAVANRLVDEKLLADEKLRRYPIPGESFKPNLAMTSRDRRYKEHFHAGKWCFSEIEQRFCWSCCLNFKEESAGCESRVVNPDAWCTLGIVK